MSTAKSSPEKSGKTKTPPYGFRKRGDPPIRSFEIPPIRFSETLATPLTGFGRESVRAQSGGSLRVISKPRSMIRATTASAMGSAKAASMSFQTPASLVIDRAESITP